MPQGRHKELTHRAALVYPDDPSGVYQPHRVGKMYECSTIMSQPGKKYMYPRAEEGRGPGSLDFSQAFKTSHLGEVLCNANPMQQKFLHQQWEDLDRAKRRRENALFHYKRNFFIAQVFGKGLNPHLNKGADQPDEDDDSATTDPGGDIANYPADHSDEPNPAQAEAAGHDGPDPDKDVNTNSDPSVDIIKNDEETVQHVEKHKKTQVTFSDLEPGSSTMITQGLEIENKPRSRAASKSIMQRCQTSGELNVRRGQSQSLPTLTSAADSVTEVTSQPSTARDKLHVSFMQERAKSTSDLADSVSKRVSTSYTLPSISSTRKNSLPRKPEIIVEEDEDSNTDYEVISVHTTTDHVGLSTLRRQQRNDISSLRRDPSRLFPKMRVLLSSYDSDTQGTFNQIMNLGGGEEEGDSFRRRISNKQTSGRSKDRVPVGRFGSKSARTTTENAEKPQRIKFKVRSAREAGIKKLSIDHDSSFHQNSNKSSQSQSMGTSKSAGGKLDREGLASAPRLESHSQNPPGYKPARRKSYIVGGSAPPDPHSQAERTGHEDLTGSTETVDGVEQSQTPADLSESQRYVKMIQQLTAFLPEHLLATAEDQIRKMSNTDQIMKFKKKMIQKNHAAMEKDTKADPRWRRLEGTLIRSGSRAKWHKRHSAWHLNEQ